MRDGSTSHLHFESNTQRSAILRLLTDARGSWVPLPEILKCAAQYSARIHELRRELASRGLEIQNRTQRINGQRHSWFRLVQKERETPKSPDPKVSEIPWEQRQRVVGLPLWDGAVRK
jgi:hypothetical protein